MTKVPNIFGEKLKAIREDEDKTLDWLASELGVNKSTILRYESGEIKDPTIAILSRVCQIFKISADYFLSKRPLKLQRELDQQEDLAAKFVALPKESVKHFRKLVILELAEVKYLKANQPLKDRYPILDNGPVKIN